MSPSLAGSVQRDLLKLEEILSSEKWVPGQFEALGTVPYRHFLCHLLMVKFLRWGPKKTMAAMPGRLITLVQSAAKKGLLGISTEVCLRDVVSSCEKRLQAKGIGMAAFWWRPLPEESNLLKLWMDLDSHSPPLGERVVLSLHEVREKPFWSRLQDCLSSSFLADLNLELRQAHDHGQLPLDRAGVGSRGALSDYRSDWALYTSGLDPRLIEETPRLAVLIQWLMYRIEWGLNGAGSSLKLRVPEKAMVARYPAPSLGYQPHVDNPGGQPDNGRAYSFVLYLNHPHTPCDGGQLVVWEAGSDFSKEPCAEIQAVGGTAVLFDSRLVPHQVTPLNSGPERWALTLWFQEGASQQIGLQKPEIGLNELLLPLEELVLEPEVVLAHELVPNPSGGRVRILNAKKRNLRAGIVCTQYGAGRGLDDWCRHHFDLGFNHIVLIFDRMEDEAEQAHAARLRRQFGRGELTLWSGGSVARDRWFGHGDEKVNQHLLKFVGYKTASWSVASRQCLNAGSALVAARHEGLGGAPLDWLVHLDADEYFYLNGSSRGGGDVQQHFEAAESAGLSCIRYVNHEILVTPSGQANPRKAVLFKKNPLLAAAGLGPVGWHQFATDLKMLQTCKRPYFNGYFNGKSAVAVRAGRSAAGVHGWHLQTDDPTSTSLWAGPSILHFHCPHAAAFVKKYMAVAALDGVPNPGLFKPSPTEEAAVQLIGGLRARGASLNEIENSLRRLFEQRTSFSKQELALLHHADLLFQPQLQHWPPQVTVPGKDNL